MLFESNLREIKGFSILIVVDRLPFCKFNMQIILITGKNGLKNFSLVKILWCNTTWFKSDQHMLLKWKGLHLRMLSWFKYFELLILIIFNSNIFNEFSLVIISISTSSFTISNHSFLIFHSTQPFPPHFEILLRNSSFLRSLSIHWHNPSGFSFHHYMSHLFIPNDYYEVLKSPYKPLKKIL